MEHPVLLATIFLIASLASAMAALLALARYGLPPSRGAAPSPAAEPTMFLFDGDRLQDATASARMLFDKLAGDGSDRDRLVAHLSRAIPGLAGALPDLAGKPRIEAVSEDGDLRVEVQREGGCERFTLTDLAAEGEYALVDCLSQRALQHELTALREIADSLPVPVWRQGKDGTVIWANPSYMRLASDGEDDEPLAWPLPQIFSTHPVQGGQNLASRRRMLKGPAGKADWYDCDLIPSTHGEIGVAMPTTAVVRAEKALRDFIQTLTKTFADLPIGLAIFDRDRQLQLFNPALIDLTSLDGEFLSARPRLFSFLDRLRESRILPEPKDYTSWRQQMLALERAAATGQYEETWPLSTGQTYRVTGRPHPEGAIAFLIEDITAEISLTRRFRSEIELAQSTLNAIDDGIAVFSRDGDLVQSNDALAELWSHDPRPMLSVMTIADAIRLWQAQAQPSDLWDDLIAFFGHQDARAGWDGSLTLADGHELTLRVAPMARGGTMVRFIRSPGQRLTVRHSHRRAAVASSALPA